MAQKAQLCQGFQLSANKRVYLARLAVCSTLRRTTIKELAGDYVY